MLLAVAGLDKPGVTEQMRRLASGDWSRFSAAERAAFGFARRLDVPETAAQDLPALVAHFGRARAVDVVWWGCHCHYMTRVADAFQLPLEHGNVFDGFLPDGEENARR
jgi:hypothetical protein